MVSAREAAYLALLSALQGKAYISETLHTWQKDQEVSGADFHLAQEIASGSIRMGKRLDFLAKQCRLKKNLKLKLKEKALLRTALYQFFFMERIPIYAIVNETIKIAHKYLHSSYAHFLNAILRKLPETPFHLPKGKSIEELSIYYSYPPFFVERLLTEYGEKDAEEILDTENTAPIIMARVGSMSVESIDQNLKFICKQPFPMVLIEKTEQISIIGRSSHYYIQNITPAYLIGSLCEYPILPPKSILDLCASPGGKTLATFDRFPHADYYANDRSENKIERMKENFSKYGLNAKISCFPAEELRIDQKFDIVIVDAPCSNSGVLNKRPEARWRITAEVLKELTEKQLSLIEHSLRFLAPNGLLWYMTCSILKEENEELIAAACQQFPLIRSGYMQTILPNKEGWDGGFACALKLKS